MTQGNLGLSQVDPLPLFIPSGAPAAEERKRLSAQAVRILDRLVVGPATNRDLSQIALKYTSRISDLRQAGYDVVAFDHDHATGVCWYRLRADGEGPE
jgi:hypothetical protein